MQTRGAIYGLPGILCVALLTLLVGYGCKPKAQSTVDTGPSHQGADSSEKARAMNSQLTTIIMGRLLSLNKTPIVPIYAEDGKQLLDPKAVVMILSGPKELEYPPIPVQSVTVIANKGKFSPTFCVCVVGQEFIVTSQDGEIHNFRLSGVEYSEQPTGTPSLDAKPFVRIFRKPFDWLWLSCGVHQSANASIAVVPSSLYSSPNQKGIYRIESRFPPGEYKLRAVAPGFGVVEKIVSIKQKDRLVELDFQFKK